MKTLNPSDPAFLNMVARGLTVEMFADSFRYLFSARRAWHKNKNFKRDGVAMGRVLEAEARRLMEGLVEAPKPVLAFVCTDRDTTLDMLPCFRKLGWPAVSIHPENDVFSKRVYPLGMGNEDQPMSEDEAHFHLMGLLPGRRVLLFAEDAELGLPLVKAAKTIAAWRGHAASALVVYSDDRGARETLSQIGVPLTALTHAGGFKGVCDTSHVGDLPIKRENRIVANLDGVFEGWNPFGALMEPRL